MAKLYNYITVLFGDKLIDSEFLSCDKSDLHVDFVFKENRLKSSSSKLIKKQKKTPEQTKRPNKFFYFIAQP